jgi:hypothetical protein
MGGPGSGRKKGSGNSSNLSSNKKWTSKGISKKEKAEGVIAKKGSAKRYSDDANRGFKISKGKLSKG